MHHSAADMVDVVETVDAKGKLAKSLVDPARRIPRRLSPTAREIVVAECLDTRHPTLVGRVLVRWHDIHSGPSRLWVPTAHGLSIRVGDRVLLVRPDNWSEPIVVAVVDGYARRETTKRNGPTLSLLPDEAVRVTTEDGAPLLEVFQASTGPVVRLMTPDVDIDVKGSLRISAETIDLRAKQGEARIEASADVVVVGETIQLN